MTTKRRKLKRSLGDILAAPAICDLTRDIQNRMRGARDQFMTFASFSDGWTRTTTPASATSARP